MSHTAGDESQGTGARIEIRLARLQQLFNSLDPSPFHDRDLDQDAEDYIVDSADEFSLPTPLTLIIYMPQNSAGPCGPLTCNTRSITTSPTG